MNKNALEVLVFGLCSIIAIGCLLYIAAKLAGY